MYWCCWWFHWSWLTTLEWCCRKRPMFPNIPTFNVSNKFSKPPKYSTILVLGDEIINDGSTQKLPLYAIPQKKVLPGIVAEMFQPSEEILPKPSPHIVAAAFQEKEQPEESRNQHQGMTDKLLDLVMRHLIPMNPLILLILSLFTYYRERITNMFSWFICRFHATGETWT